MTTTTAAMTAAETGEAEAGGSQSGGGSLLQEVQDRGTLRCGVNDAVPGFGFTGESGEPEGFDIDFCKVVAAAVLGDAEAVEYTPLSAEQRFTALQSGEIDVLIRNTTYTSSRDGTEGARFLHTTFYDGQGMMVPADSGYESLEDMAGETICVLSGTTTELNLESQFQARGIDYTPLAFEDNEPLQAAFVEERCGAWTSDKSQLAGIRSSWPEDQGGPEALVILDETMSKEPLGPVVADGDDDWADAVNWAVISTIQAEEFGLDSGNVEQAERRPGDPALPRPAGRGRALRLRARAARGLRGAGHQPGRELRRDLRPQRRRGLGARASARSECALDRRRPPVRAAVPLDPTSGGGGRGPPPPPDSAMTAATASTSRRPPFWRNLRVLRLVLQVVFVAAVAGFLLFLLDNLVYNLERRGIPTGFDYLRQPAGFAIPDSDFRSSQSLFDALLVGIQNTIKVGAARDRPRDDPRRRGRRCTALDELARSQGGGRSTSRRSATSRCS